VHKGGAPLGRVTALPRGAHRDGIHSRDASPRTRFLVSSFPSASSSWTTHAGPPPSLATYPVLFVSVTSKWPLASSTASLRDILSFSLSLRLQILRASLFPSPSLFFYALSRAPPCIFLSLGLDESALTKIGPDDAIGTASISHW